MRVLLISVGSRGDTEPFCALAQGLSDRGHTVVQFVQQDQVHLVPTTTTTDGAVGGVATVHVHTLPFVTNDFYRFNAQPTYGHDHANPRVRFVGIVADVIGELVLPCATQVLDVANNESCNVIVCSSLARSVAFAVAQALDLPTYLVHLQSLVPTGLFPHFSQAEACVDRLMEIAKSSSAAAKGEEEDSSSSHLPILQTEYMDWYWELERYQHDFLKDRLDNMYATLGLEDVMTFDKLRIILSGRATRPNVYLVNAVANELVPVVPDAGPNLFNVGALGDAYIPKNFVIPDKNSAMWTFLQGTSMTGDDQEIEKKKRPICIGFGSMPYSSEKVEGLLQVVKDLALRAVLVGKALDVSTRTLSSLDAEWVDQNTIHVESIPYAWLLPHCSVMVCHGGAGVVHAALRAGAAVVVSPLIGDQFFFARLLEARGLGAQAGSTMSSMTQDEFRSALKKSLTCTDAATALGDKICSHMTGVEQLAQILEKTSLP